MWINITIDIYIEYCSYHSTSGYCSGRSIVNVVRLEDDFAVRRHWQPITVGQRQCSVVIQHGIQVFNPEWVDWSIEYQPNMFASFSTQSFPPQSRKNAVSPKSFNVSLFFSYPLKDVIFVVPVISSNVQTAKHLSSWNGFRIHPEFTVRLTAGTQGFLQTEVGERMSRWIKT